MDSARVPQGAQEPEGWQTSMQGVPAAHKDSLFLLDRLNKLLDLFLHQYYSRHVTVTILL